MFFTTSGVVLGLAVALTGRIVSAGNFTCNDGCVIYDGYVDDNFCDCSNCEDEPDWNCTTCTCPTSCGSWNYCYTSTWTYAPYTTQAIEEFVCHDGCEIHPSWENDGWCDCTGCEDETNWDCNTCSCPEECGDFEYCGSSYTTLVPGSTEAYNGYGNFTCDDGCMVPSYWVNDNWCDCSNCEDEVNWDCSSCTCPTDCGDYEYCGYYYTTSEPYNGYGNFTCDDGCQVPVYWVDDDWCDCSNCEDETDWDCSSCTCPTTCGDYEYCLGTPATTDITEYFTCDDGCQIHPSWENDHWCDCTNCEDEWTTGWGCDSCQCPTECGDYYYCPNYNFTYGTFTCDDGCAITAAWVNDDWCDCSNCEDETTTGWDCTSCECPTECGDFYYCPSTTTSMAATYTCDDGCEIPESWVEDDWCDCSNCEDETDWDCTSCTCPTECGDYYLCTSMSTSSPISGGSGGAQSNGIFDTSGSSGKVALALVIIGIVAFLIIIGLIVAKVMGRKRGQEEKVGIANLDGMAVGNDDNHYNGMGMVGMATNNGTAVGSNYAEPDHDNDNNAVGAGAGGTEAPPPNPWNELIDLDEPRDTNAVGDGGEASVAQGGTGAPIVLPDQPALPKEHETPGNPFDDDDDLVEDAHADTNGGTVGE